MSGVPKVGDTGLEPLPGGCVRADNGSVAYTKCSEITSDSFIEVERDVARAHAPASTVSILLLDRRSLERLFPRLRQLRVVLRALPLADRGTDEIEVEQLFDEIEQPFRLFGLDGDDLARVGALRRVRR